MRSSVIGSKKVAREAVLGMEPGNPTSTAVRTGVQPLPVSVPEAVFPMGVDMPAATSMTQRAAMKDA